MSWSLDSIFDAISKENNYWITRFENALLIQLKDYGDLELTLTLTQKQILVETNISPVNVISRPAEFNLFLLRLQKILPLSTVGISQIQQQEFYIAFGSLAVNSSLDNVILEIETLAENALELAELIEEFVEPTSRR